MRPELLRFWLLIAVIAVLSIIYIFLLIKRRGLRVEVSEPSSYLYVAFWVYWYRFKTDFLPILFAVIVFILSLVELIGPFTHLLPEQKMGIRIFIVVALLVAAIFTLMHHSHLKKRIKQHETVISSIRVVLEDEAAPENQDEADRTVKILDAMVFALQCERENIKMNATVVTQKVGENFFAIHAQDRNNNFDTGITVPAKDSAAGKVIEAEENAKKAMLEGKSVNASLRPLLYVPSVRYKHAVLIGLEKRGTDQVFPTTRIIPSAYALLSAKTNAPGKIESLLCIQIPLFENGEREKAVFCLSAHKANRMGALDFAVARMAAVLLARIMSDS